MDYQADKEYFRKQLLGYARATKYELDRIDKSIPSVRNSVKAINTSTKRVNQTIDTLLSISYSLYLNSQTYSNLPKNVESMFHIIYKYVENSDIAYRAVVNVKSKPTVEAIRYAWYATLYAKSLGKAVIHTIFNDDNLEKSLDVADKLREKLWKAAADFKASSFLNSGYSPSDSPNSGEVVSVNTNAWGSIPKGDRIANTGHTAYGLKPFNKMEEEKRKKQPKTFGALPNWPPPSLLKRQSFGYGGAQKKQTRKRRQALAHTRRGRGRA